MNVKALALQAVYIYGHEIERQKRVKHLRGDVHQHRDKSERPYAAGNLAPSPGTIVRFTPEADIRSAALHRAVTAMRRRRLRRRKGGLSAALCRDRRRTVWQ